ncbi:thiamine pyrophosphate-binding protein [Candidatus Magnetaquicoccus inordinatus]|uniref:thiamine pyrophosphate-binding protein n=1 Tax=Candidatus Magnetaquicoccus inordinatus TaxID=2496818 RepID=UPI00102B1562|nr:thiamine pyrophosphate-binding protein [Candidatus Magnetaquicoccus inordinatus]
MNAASVGTVIPFIESESRQIQLTCADLILYYLEQIGVEYIFGVPGGAIEPLFNALARFSRQGRMPRALVARHESGAAFMADGYTRESSRLGVCCATTGPGATNLITGVASAYEDRIPMLVITAQTALPNFGRNALQESTQESIHVLGMFDCCTRYNSMVSHPNQLERKLIKALTAAFSHPKGPVHLNIPYDILGEEMNVQLGSMFNLQEILQEPKTIDEKGINKLCQRIRCSHKVVIFLDKGAYSAIDQIMEFAELTQIPIVTTPAGKFLVNAYHSLYHGVFGFAGHASAHKVLLDKDVDLILAVGTNFSEISSGGWDAQLLTDKLVHIDANRDNFPYSPMAKQHLVGNLQLTFSALIQQANKILDAGYPFPGKAFAMPISDQDRPLNYVTLHHPTNIKLEDEHFHIAAGNKIKPQQLVYNLARLFPDNTRFMVDAGNSWAWMTHYLSIRQSNNYRIGMGFGAMSWGIGAAVGTALGNRFAPVVCVTGDGSFLMSGQELTVAVAERLAVIFVILNDRALGMVKHGQRLGGGEAIGFELPKVDFAMMGKAMGADSYVIKKSSDFMALDIEKMCRRLGPTILDVHIDPEEVPPIGNRLKALGRPGQAS